MKSSHVLTFKSLLVWLAILLCHMHTGLAQGQSSHTYYPQRRYNADIIDCQNVSEIVFLSFLPCLRNDSGFEASENISECDLLAEAAAHLAVERVNQDPNTLHNITLKLYPIYVPNGKGSFTLHDQYETLLQIFELLYKPEYSNSIWGVIGPNDNPGVANFVAAISASSGLLTVSYGARTTNSKTESIPSFYRTLPSDDAANIGRLIILVNHEWYRIAILKSNEEEYYSEESSHFISIFNRYVNDEAFGQIKLDRTEAFTHSPDTALKNIKARDINIIIGFFGPENARIVLCKALSEELISPQHAWVLPSYYDPNWWRSPNSTDCSDDDMRDILESVIFVDNVKLPPVGLPLDDFHGKLTKKTLDLFPSLTEEDLKPYLLRSRATNAYDAVTLLAQSVGVAFDQGGDSCTDTSLVQTTFESIFMQCEYCRLYTAISECFQLIDKNFTTTIEQCGVCNKLPPDHNIDPSHVEELYPELFHDNLAWYLKNLYGQVLYSQFLSGEECPVVLWWPVLSDLDYNKSYLLIADFDDSESNTSCVAKRLNLSRRNFVNNDTASCSTHFYWRGSFVPPSSQFLQVSFISIGEFIVIGIIVLIGMIFAILLLIFNIVWRNNKNVKASSPWMNVVLLAGILLRLPTSIYNGLILSGFKYAGLVGMDFTPLCYVGFWQYYIGDVLFVATLIAKNWRIYKIFFNKELKERGYQLSDRVLIIGILLLMLPVIIILIIWTGFGTNYEGFPLQNENLQIILISVCATEPPLVFESLTNAIIFILFLFLLVLALLNASRSVSSSIFRRQGLATYKVVVLVILPSPIFFLGRLALIFSDRGIQYRALIWLEFCWITVLPIIILVVLFAPIIYAVIREYLNKKRASAEEKESRKLSTQYDDLKHRADTLRSQLKQTDKTIRRIKTDLALGAGTPLARNSAGRSSWHGTTELDILSEATVFDSGSAIKLRSIIIGVEPGNRNCTPQKRDSRIATGEVSTVKENSNSLLTILSSPGAKTSTSCQELNMLSHTDEK